MIADALGRHAAAENQDETLQRLEGLAVVFDLPFPKEFQVGLGQAFADRRGIFLKEGGHDHLGDLGIKEPHFFKPFRLK